MMRLDKYLSKAALMTRSVSQGAIRRGRVTVNGTLAKSGDMKLDEKSAIVCLDGEVLKYSEYIYIMLNKPAGVLSATDDGKGMTVLDLLPEAYKNTDIFPVGRLDKDTVGLLMLTDNGALAHKMLSPKHHVDKVYYLKTQAPISPDDERRIEEGVYIGEGITTMPAELIVDEDGMGGHLTIREGKFHQVKRMLEAVGNKVVFLERVRFGTLVLDENLNRGAWRRLTSEEEKELTDNFA